MKPEKQALSCTGSGCTFNTGIYLWDMRRKHSFEVVLPFHPLGHGTFYGLYVTIVCSCCYRWLFLNRPTGILARVQVTFCRFPSILHDVAVMYSPFAFAICHDSLTFLWPSVYSLRIPALRNSAAHPQSCTWTARCPDPVVLSHALCSYNCSLTHHPAWLLYTRPREWRVVRRAPSWQRVNLFSLPLFTSQFLFW